MGKWNGKSRTFPYGVFLKKKLSCELKELRDEVGSYDPCVLAWDLLSEEMSYSFRELRDKVVDVVGVEGLDKVEIIKFINNVPAAERFI